MNPAAKMKALRPFTVLAVTLSLSGYAMAQTTVEDAWARATVPGQPATGAFMTLKADADSTLISVQSPAAKDTQIHQSTMKGDVMSMLPVDEVSLPAGEPVVFDANGYHVMLMGLVKQVKEGDAVPLTLKIKNAQGEEETLEVNAVARALNAPDHAHAH
ncbi:copper chaperone PCu(A)C [Pseudomonas rhizosphaerae]|jgi:copper(I)-binding protein|uniref:copper chaperone PCu(A)C n=1 Tax=Pseudomonas rhizosphaerae TaxID=216142 RepID=UPI002B4687DF|nr:copper chaperone PCu(A)C [Pseudomonas rhizosphaerae]MEB2869767.1 copper chaperone PCu(A)C [Pseudomonas rhizosphaerae]